MAIYPTETGNGQNLSVLQLTFSRDQLVSYKKWRIAGLDRKSVNWMNKATEIIWDCAHGVISRETMDSVRYIALTKYKCVYSQRKVLYFAKGLLKYLTKTTFDTRFQAFELFLEMPKVPSLPFSFHLGLVSLLLPSLNSPHLGGTLKLKKKGEGNL